MAKVRSWAGLDVHARSVLAVTLDAQSGELRSQRLPGETAKVVEFLRSGCRARRGRRTRRARRGTGSRGRCTRLGSGVWSRRRGRSSARRRTGSRPI